MKRGGQFIIAAAAIYMVGAYVAAFIAGWFDVDAPDLFIALRPVPLAFAVVGTIMIGPILGGIVIYQCARELRERR